MLTSPDIDEDRLLTSLRSLIAVPSANPGSFEDGVAREIASQLDGCASSLTFVNTLPGRRSLAAVIDSGRPGPRLVLNGHMDTVPIGPRDAWSYDPYGGELVNGRVYGRGACDMKAGLAAHIEVARALTGFPLARGALILQFAVGEETAEPGTASLLAAGFGGDIGIVGEPTSMRVAIAQRGLAFVRVKIHGQGGHAGQPHETRNPITAIPAVLVELDRYLDGVSDRGHALLGAPTCTPTIVRGGDTANVVPSTCELVVDRRLLPGENVVAELELLRARLRAARRLTAFDVDVELGGNVFEPSEAAPGSSLAGALLDELELVTGCRPPLVGTPYASDMRNLVLDGNMDAVTFGPGSILQAHRPDEFVPVADVTAAARVLLRLVLRLLGPR